MKSAFQWSQISPNWKILYILTATKEFLSRSDEATYELIDPADIVKEVDDLISYLIVTPAPKPKLPIILFAPTGPIQELAMVNGWHDQYLMFAALFDELEYVFEKDL